MTAVSIVLAFLAVSSGRFQSESGLLQYVNKPDSTFAWERTVRDGHDSIRLKSQTWQGIVWQHDLVRIDPPVKSNSGAAIIEVTGWEPNERDYALAQLLAESSGLPVYVLFQIPNQPLWGREEDALIAYSVEQYLTGKGDDWPLLLPMVKSVKSAMDAIQESTKGLMSRFIVTGASKRGWTTWLVAATEDERVIGIAPRVFDNLDFIAQLDRQKEYWGGYSPMIRDYTDRGLEQALATPKGTELIQMVDPIKFTHRITQPVLIINGTNDPYWTVDSLVVYWEALTMPTWVVQVPGADHGLKDTSLWVPTLGWFASSLSREKELPKIEFKVGTKALDIGTWTFSVKAKPSPSSYAVWTATSTDLHFEESDWSTQAGSTTVSQGDVWSLTAFGRRFRTLNKAIFIELTYKVGGLERKLTTPIYLVKKSLH